MLYPTDIRPHWDEIKDKVAMCCGDGDRPEDVYAACLMKDAYFYTNEEVSTFMVFREGIHPKSYKKELFVWIMYSDEREAYQKYLEWTITLAAKINAETIAFATERKGWEKVLGSEWRLRGVTYERSTL